MGRAVALAQVLGLTGTSDGIASLRTSSKLLSTIVTLVLDPAEVIATDACLALINLSADVNTVPVLLQISIVDSLVNILCQEKYNSGGQEMNFLGPVLSNLSQLPEVRNHILDRQKCVIQRLVAFTEYSASVVKRGGVVGTIRNCCFDTDHHDWLISDKVDIVPRLVLPLAGPAGDSITDEEMDSLPVDLQYLDEDKRIEKDLDVKIMLLESLTQLCATKWGREQLREKNIYVILRELHKVEKDRGCLLAVENLVDILIKKEDEIKIDNYKQVDVPEDLHDKFKQMDETYLKD